MLIFLICLYHFSCCFDGVDLYFSFIRHYFATKSVFFLVHFPKFPSSNSQFPSFLPSLSISLSHLSGDDEGCVKVWDLRKNSAIFTFKEHTDYVSDLVIPEHSKNILLSCSGDGTLTVLHLRKGILVAASDNQVTFTLSLSSLHPFSSPLHQPSIDLLIYPPLSLSIAGDGYVVSFGH